MLITLTGDLLAYLGLSLFTLLLFFLLSGFSTFLSYQLLEEAFHLFHLLFYV